MIIHIRHPLCWELSVLWIVCECLPFLIQCIIGYEIESYSDVVSMHFFYLVILISCGFNYLVTYLI